MPLPIIIPETDFYDPRLNRFITTKYTKIELEHSLISISKWESKWHKAYLSREPKTEEQDLDYIRCMCITRNVDPNVFSAIDRKTRMKIASYVADPQTAVKHIHKEQQGMKDAMTNELIYFYMSYYGIPFEPCEKWHLNHLLSLIEVCARKSQTPKKRGMSREMLNERAALNAQRRARYNTRG